MFSLFLWSFFPLFYHLKDWYDNWNYRPCKRGVWCVEFSNSETGLSDSRATEQEEQTPVLHQQLQQESKISYPPYTRLGWGSMYHKAFTRVDLTWVVNYLSHMDADYRVKSHVALCWQDQRGVCEEALLRVKGVISFTFQMALKRCTVRIRADLPTEVHNISLSARGEATNKSRFVFMK